MRRGSPGIIPLIRTATSSPGQTFRRLAFQICGFPGFFCRSNILLTPDFSLTRQLLPLAFGLPLPFHPLPDLPGQTDRQPGLFLKAGEQLLRLFHGLAGCFQTPVPLADLRVLLPEIRYRLLAGYLAGRLTL